MQRKPTLLLVKDNMEEDQLVLNELSKTWESHFNLFHARQISEAEKIITDIVSIGKTEQEHTAKALLEYREMLKVVIDNIPQYIFWKDSNLHYLGCNSKFGLALGLNKTEDIKGKTDHDLALKNKGINAFPKIDRRVIASGKPELNLIARQPEINGNFFWQRINKIPLCDVNGNVTGVLSTFEDVTKRILTEKRLKKAKKQAEDAMKLKDKFVSLVTHDLRSPFTSFMGFLELLEKDNEHPLSNKQKKMVSLMLNSSGNLLSMIDELLNLSRLQTGSIKLRPRFLDGFMFSEMVVDMLRGKAMEKEIEVINEVEKGTRLYADRDLFREVITNLLSNAIKFCNRGDRITLYVPSGRSTCIAVKDTGIGISPKNLPNLFKHEEKTTTKGTAGEEGTGLGLPFSKDIMALHNGALTVESIEGEGCVFYADLPLVRPIILIVDDEEIVRFTLKEDLSLLDADFIEAENGIKAVESIKNKIPHLIVTDIRMAGMSGFELIEHVRNNPATKNIPIIVITSRTDMEIRETAFQKGANDFLTKPWKLHDLIPRVRRFIQ